MGCYVQSMVLSHVEFVRRCWRLRNRVRSVKQRRLLMFQIGIWTLIMCCGVTSGMRLRSRSSPGSRTAPAQKSLYAFPHYPSWVCIPAFSSSRLRIRFLSEPPDALTSDTTRARIEGVYFPTVLDCHGNVAARFAVDTFM